MPGLTGRPGGYLAPMTQQQDSQSTEPQPDNESGPRVLLVDDAAAIRNALRGVLEDAGIEVVGEAPDGIEGVELTGSLRPDVVLMDLRMPSSDGFEATAAIVKGHPDVRVVVLQPTNPPNPPRPSSPPAPSPSFPSTAAPTASARPSSPPGAPSQPVPRGGAQGCPQPPARALEGDRVAGGWG